MIDLSNASSRPLGVAAGLVGTPLSEEAFFAKPVVLTADPFALESENGKWCYLDALMLLLRVAGCVTAHLPSDCPQSFSDVVAKTFRRVQFRPGAKLVLGALKSEVLENAVAILNIGAQRRSPQRWINVSAAGWTARVSDESSEASVDFNRANPITSLFAASIGVSEVFRRLADVPADRFPRLGSFSFSLWGWSDEDAKVGPDLVNPIALPPTLIVGAGAIGNGLALVLSQLPVRGRIHILDKQDYGDENLGTCTVMGNKGWSSRAKAERLAAWLQTNNKSLQVTAEKILIEEALQKNDPRVSSAQLVLGALDEVAPRRELQLLWPDVYIDGGIGAMGATVNQHRYDTRGLACIRCVFHEPALRLEEVQSQQTGLPAYLLNNGERNLTDDDIAVASPDRREWLSQKMREGKTVCSILGEAAQGLLGLNTDGVFKPSAPFVATAAAAMMAAEIIKAVSSDVHYSQSTTIQNLLLGSRAMDRFDRPADARCTCVTNRAVIDRAKQRGKL